MVDSTTLILALTTEADEPQAEALARNLLERRLAACVSFIPVRSVYSWEGTIQRASEVQLLLKTSPECLGALHRAVMELHSYDIPEWLSWPVQSSEAYGLWALAAVNSDGMPQDR